MNWKMALLTELFSIAIEPLVGTRASRLKERRFSLARRSFSEGGNRRPDGRDELRQLRLVPKFNGTSPAFAKAKARQAETTESVPPGRPSLNPFRRL